MRVVDGLVEDELDVGADGAQAYVESGLCGVEFLLVVLGAVEEDIDLLSLI
jgi:hypothetical protein